MLLENTDIDYTRLITLDEKGDQSTNIFLKKLAKMNYSVFINCASLFINSTFIDEK